MNLVSSFFSFCLRHARRYTHFALAAVCAVQISACASAPRGKTYAPGDLRSAGAVGFPISCAETVRPDFVRGVALLHSFFYEEARRIFTAIAEREPRCAMAQWGIAMTWWHPIWTPPTPEELAAGKAAAERATQLEATPRERAFIKAIGAYYSSAAAPDSSKPVGQSCHGPMGPRERVFAYGSAMREVYEKYKGDFEVDVFYAFSILSEGYATPEDLSLSKQKIAGKMLAELWKKNRKHPGVAHYLIHSYDYPSLASRALEPAKAYAEIAPWVPHALHMPSHIFTRLGMWNESVETNQASAEASRAYAKQRGRTAAEVEELHALDYMMYSYLQEGRDRAAKEVLDAVARVESTYPELEFIGAYALAAVPARYALERNAWEEAASLRIPPRPQWAKFPFVEALFEYAHAFGRVRTGDLNGAQQAIARMNQLRDRTTQPQFAYFRNHLDLQIQAASAWLALAKGEGERALKMLKAAAASEDALGKHPVTPGALVPAREQLGEMLLSMKRPREALESFETALKYYPSRFSGIFGAARAAEAIGDHKRARKSYTALLKQAKRADTQRTELTHARNYLAGQSLSRK